jgi:hypothetical protein
VSGFNPLLALDSWAEPARVWLTGARGRIQVFADRGDRFELLRDFVSEVEKAGHTPHMMAAYSGSCIVADPVRGHLYRLGAKCHPLVRIDPEDGRKWTVIDTGRMPPGGPEGGLEDVMVGLDGLLYVRNMYYISRFDPDRMGDALVPDAEVPFDYGEEKGRGHQALRGVLDISWAQGGANWFNNGFAVAPDGSVLALVENYQDIKMVQEISHGLGGVGGKPDNKYFTYEIARDRYRPRIFPGRLYAAGTIVRRWDPRGEMTAEDLLPGSDVGTCGIRADAAGNIYVGIHAHQVVDGQPQPAGAFAKFPPTGGRFTSSFGAIAPLESPPRRTPDFCGYGLDQKIWARNMYWSHPGLDQLHFVDPHRGGGYPCACAICRFDTDLYGRSFYPKAYQFTVGVVDTNGNPICSIGRYGNCDSPAMKPGDTDIGFAHCSFVTAVSDRWLYLNDNANARIIRLGLGYRAEERVPLK